MVVGGTKVLLIGTYCPLEQRGGKAFAVPKKVNIDLMVWQQSHRLISKNK